MVEESTRLQDIRLERLRDLQTRHQSELAEFDAVSRRHLESPRLSRSSNTSSTRGRESPRMSRGNPFNTGSSRDSGRSFGPPTGRYSEPNRNSSASLSSLQSNLTQRSSVSSQYSSQSTTNMTSGSTRPRNDSRNGRPGDRHSYYEQSSNRRWESWYRIIRGHSGWSISNQNRKYTYLYIKEFNK